MPPRPRGSRDTIGQWSCTRCSKTFTTKSNLKVHCQSHEGPFNCTVRTTHSCRGVYSSKKGLKEHEDLIRSNKRRRRPPGVCPVCGKEFTRLNNMKRHKAKIHQPKFQRSEETEPRASDDSAGAPRSSMARDDNSCSTRAGFPASQLPQALSTAGEISEKVLYLGKNPPVAEPRASDISPEDPFLDVDLFPRPRCRFDELPSASAVQSLADKLPRNTPVTFADFPVKKESESHIAHWDGTLGLPSAVEPPCRVHLLGALLPASSLMAGACASFPADGDDGMQEFHGFEPYNETVLRHHRSNGDRRLSTELEGTASSMVGPLLGGGLILGRGSAPTLWQEDSDRPWLGSENCFEVL